MRIGVIMGTGHGLEGTTGSMTSDLVTRIRKHVEQVEVDLVTTDDLDLGPSCAACLSCMTAGEDTCPNFTSAERARQIMDDSDIVIFATPVHSFTLSATMKRFVDHFAYLIHRPRYFGTPAVLVSTAAGAGHDAALGYLESAVRRWGFHTVAQLGVNGPGLAKAPYRRRVEAALDEVAQVVVDEVRDGQEPTPTTKDLIGFRVARLLVEAGRTDGPVDAIYWDERGWFGADWFTDRKPPFFGNLLAGFVEARIRKGIERGSSKPYRG